MDTTRVGEIAAMLMEGLDEMVGEDGLEVGEVAVVAEIHGETDGEGWSAVHVQCSDDRGWVQRGLLSEAMGDE